MLSVNVLSLAPDVNHWLADSRNPRFLHIFDHACNLINERREVLSIVTPQIGNGPFNLVIESDLCFVEHINVQSPISNSPSHLALGDLAIHTSTAKYWNPRPDWESLHAKKGDICYQVKQLLITNYINLDRFDTFFGTPSDSRNQQSLQSNQSLVSNLSLALANGDLSSAQKVASQLAGLGFGLTPAGDDFIMGAIYAAGIIHSPEVASALVRAIADTAAPLTTSLSAAWLRAAGNGEAGILWHEYFDALISSEVIGIQQTIDKILAMGETSGADALAGFITTLGHVAYRTNL